MKKTSSIVPTDGRSASPGTEPLLQLDYSPALAEIEWFASENRHLSFSYAMVKAASDVICCSAVCA